MNGRTGIFLSGSATSGIAPSRTHCKQKTGVHPILSNLPDPHSERRQLVSTWRRKTFLNRNRYQPQEAEEQHVRQQ